MTERRSGRRFFSVGEILRGSSMLRQIRTHHRQSGLRRAWAQVAGEETAALARAVRYSGGRLRVDVASPALLLELSSFRKADLIERLREQPGFEGLVDIVFRQQASRGATARPDSREEGGEP